ncbi:1-acyl-sn-glycerol-3-phosphate acyltransferase [Gulosibacter macacae]|uniref:1-acyl-sn-glycerol-3-phosphate acyltransferase n=1 Tax=Gulosibacter macacae TaxID=2488791 RepID=A0A3P3VUA7_9MICO|nr:lysophospholipid acyltransferase family protein [Gulosibacter macacae]RRJ86260.1 1-acyl-sn-glycerol-3-phosphate acyltransferase [Gulosibacter macacae]
MMYSLLKNTVVGPAVRRLFRPEVIGAENIPAKGPVIFASNHLSVIDSIIMPVVVKRQVFFLAKAEYFQGKSFKGRLTSWFMKSVGQLSIDRSGGAASQASLDTGVEVLDTGRWLCIYPEGTRSPDARLYRGRTGIARMLLQAKESVPVIPVVMIDTEKVMPIGASRPKPGRTGVVFGKPIDFSRYRTMHADRFVLRAMTDEIMSEIAALSDQEYADVYASTLRKKLDAAKN